RRANADYGSRCISSSGRGGDDPVRYRSNSDRLEASSSADIQAPLERGRLLDRFSLYALFISSASGGIRALLPRRRPGPPSSAATVPPRRQPARSRRTGISPDGHTEKSELLLHPCRLGTTTIDRAQRRSEPEGVAVRELAKALLSDPGRAPSRRTQTGAGA